MNGRKECSCPMARHKHGTPTGYSVCRCKCLPCRLAYGEQNRAWRAGKRTNAERSLPAVDATGSRRRIQALHAVGWNGKEIADRLGVTHQYVHKLRTDLDRIMPATAARVADLYDELWDKQPPAETREQRRAASYARTNAKRHGWHVPMAWDDDCIDDPDYVPEIPTVQHRDYKPCGTEAAYRRHLRNGEPIDAACQNANTRRVRGVRERKNAA